MRSTRSPSSALVLTLALGAGTVGCGARLTPLRDQGAVLLATPAPEGDVRAAIVRALTARGFTAEAEQPNKIVARLDSRGMLLRVSIDYSPTEFAISYIDSQGYNYQVGPQGPMISSRYTQYTENLRRSIRDELGRPAREAQAAVEAQRDHELALAEAQRRQQAHDGARVPLGGHRQHVVAGRFAVRQRILPTPQLDQPTFGHQPLQVGDGEIPGAQVARAQDAHGGDQFEDLGLAGARDCWFAVHGWYCVQRANVCQQHSLNKRTPNGRGQAVGCVHGDGFLDAMPLAPAQVVGYRWLSGAAGTHTCFANINTESQSCDISAIILHWHIRYSRITYRPWCTSSHTTST